MLVAHCCYDYFVLIQSLHFLFLSLSSLHSSCVRVVTQGGDAMYWARKRGFGPEVEV